MATYTVYHRTGEAPDRAVFVTEGFSFAAMVFSFLWALWHRMWIVAAVLFSFFALLSAASASAALDPVAIVAIETAMGLLLGLEGQALREWSLRLAGFREIGLVQASCREAAELKYFAESEPQSRSRPPPVSLRAPDPGQSDPLGLFGNV